MIKPVEYQCCAIATAFDVLSHCTHLAEHVDDNFVACFSSLGSVTACFAESLVVCPCLNTAGFEFGKIRRLSSRSSAVQRLERIVYCTSHVFAVMNYDTGIATIFF